MEFLSQTYVALRGPTGAPQNPAEIIGRLSDRLTPATLLADRRAAVLSLKGLSRDCKQDVGNLALPGLLYVLVNDAQVDPDIGKAVLETLNILCDAEDNSADLSSTYTDSLLANEQAISTIFTLLGDTTMYTRFATLQLLSTLLRNRRQAVQSLFMKSQSGPSSVMSLLEDKREMIRNEAIGVVQSLTSQSPDIQKVLAFEGAFEKIFNVVTQEGGIEGGVVAHDALTCVDGLLRFNSSNQSYFRETQLPPILCHLLQFPPVLPLDQTAPQQFALQFWDDQKRANATIIIGIIGMLVGSKGTNPQESVLFSRCLIEIGLASNFPTSLKTQALRLFPANPTFALSELHVTPYMPVPQTNEEEWDRLESASALDVLVELGLHGEYNGVDAGQRRKDCLELRTAAVAVFENFTRREEVRIAILQAMLPSAGSSEAPPITPLLYALATPPSVEDPASILSTQLAALLFTHLLRNSPQAKELARTIKPGPLHPPSASQYPSGTAAGGSFFVPADGNINSSQQAPAPEPGLDDDDEPPQSLLHTLSENLSLAFLSRSRADQTDKEAREWDRIVVVYLCLLAQWLWEDPLSVRDYLDTGGLGVLVEPINHTSDLDTVVPGLCALLLGICYEFNRTPGEITRSDISPILNRLGVDMLVGRTTRLREDERFKAVGPDSCVLAYPSPSSVAGLSAHPFAPSGRVDAASDVELGDGEIWFDWSFIDFWKSNYYTIQKGFSTEPDQLSSSSGTLSPETTALIASLQETIRHRTEEISALKGLLAQKDAAPPPAPANTSAAEIASLQAQLSTITTKLRTSEENRKDVEKEQEDLLVLLDEVNVKRTRDKARLKAAGMDVSEDEDEGDDEE